ncbi:MAG: PQQ-dependent sugar dehydrogenase, partial [Bacteroidetes bacterium]
MKKSVWLLAIFMAFVSGSACLAQNGRSELIRSEKLNFRLDTIVTGLKVPWGMAFLPNGDILVTERQGRLRLVQNGRLHPEPIKGVPEVWANGQGGLLDLELHPQYETNGWIYLSYSGPAQKGEKGSGANTTFIRARLQNHQLVDQEVLLRAQPNYNRGVHFGGRIEFDRQGYVYLSIGDRGGRSENQTLNNYRGKVFRLHDDGRIPADNPFVNVPGAVKATFTYGHRNPQGLALNPQTGEMWEHEHGPRGGDEVNILRKGNNYGWPTITYGINYNGTIITRDTVKEGMEQPVLFWRPSIA